MSNRAGTIYLVATPIGNLEDMSPRAIRVLKEADLIAAEDTRHSAPLLRHFAVTTPVVAYHDHNERRQAQFLVDQALGGKDIALISDAGTPLVNDPGYRLVRAAHAAGLSVISIPGPCAAIAALSIAGLPTDEFLFAGFPPAKQSARLKFFEARRHQHVTLIFYESRHRIMASLKDMARVFGDDREVVIARELTKKFETLRRATLAKLIIELTADPEQQMGEFVVIVRGVDIKILHEVNPEAEHVLKVLSRELPPKKAAALTSEITGVAKKILYDMLVSENEE